MVSAKNQLLPELNLSIGYRFIGLGDELFGTDGIAPPNPGSGALNVLSEGNNSEAFFNLTYLPPAIGKRRQKLGVSNAQKQLIADTKRLEEAERAHMNQLTNEVRQLDSLYASAEQSLNQVCAANREVQSLEIKRNREVVYDQLLDAQRRQTNALIQYWRALCEYNRQIARVHWVKGSLLDHNNIYMAEGQWPKKAYWDAMERARERDASTYMDYGFTRPAVLSRGPVQQQSEDFPGMATPIPMDAPLFSPSPTPSLAPAIPLESVPDSPSIEELPNTNYEDGAPAPRPPG